MRFETAHLISTQREQDSPKQRINNAGGWSFCVSPEGMFERFLVMGTTGGTYYVNERKLSRDAFTNLEGFARANYSKALSLTQEVSERGRAKSNSPALFALAALASRDLSDDEGAAAFSLLRRVARIPTHLFEFLNYVEELRGRYSYRANGIRDAVREWYLSKPEKELAYHCLKYQSRINKGDKIKGSNRNILRRYHPRPQTEAQDDIFDWVVNGNVYESWDNVPDYFKQIQVASHVMRLEKSDKNLKKVIAGIVDHDLTREMVPTWALKDPYVWEALVHRMPPHAFLRNIVNMAKVGFIPTGIAPKLPRALEKRFEELQDEDYLRKKRVHPLDVLVALRMYKPKITHWSQRVLFRQQGEVWDGSEANALVTQALEDMFYKSFGAVEPTGKLIMLALDVSGSMSQSAQGLPMLSCAEVAAAWAMLSVRTEDSYAALGFSDRLVNLGLQKTHSLDQALTLTSNVNFGPTDCSAPFREAYLKRVPFDLFVVLTDNETWYGDTHPHVALQAYRQHTGINAKSAVVGMAATNFTIANPDDAGMVDIVGMDPSVPNFIREWSNNEHAYTKDPVVEVGP